jgi:hypothetical protein
LLRSAPSSSALSTSLRWCLRVRAKPSSAGGRSRVERSRDGADAAQGGQGLTRLSTRIVAQEAKVRSALKGLRKCTAPKPETRTSAALTNAPACTDPMATIAGCTPTAAALHGKRAARCARRGRLAALLCGAATLSSPAVVALPVLCHAVTPQGYRTHAITAMVAHAQCGCARGALACTRASMYARTHTRYTVARMHAHARTHAHAHGHIGALGG